MLSEEITQVALDDQTVALYLEVPGPKVVLLQALFESYECIGTVRTIDIKRSLVCILTTRAMLDDCLKLLDTLQEEIPWNPSPNGAAEHGEEFLGYGKKGR